MLYVFLIVFIGNVFGDSSLKLKADKVNGAKLTCGQDSASTEDYLDKFDNNNFKYCYSAAGDDCVVDKEEFKDSISKSWAGIYQEITSEGCILLEENESARMIITQCNSTLKTNLGCTIKQTEKMAYQFNEDGKVTECREMKKTEKKIPCASSPDTITTIQDDSYLQVTDTPTNDGYANCPAEKPQRMSPCDFQGTCPYGEELCCGQSHPEYECVCGQQGRVRCTSPPPCQVADCGYEPDTEPKDPVYGEEDSTTTKPNDPCDSYGEYGSYGGYGCQPKATPKPSRKPTPGPTPVPSKEPTIKPSAIPSNAPTVKPSPQPTKKPTPSPTPGPSKSPTIKPTSFPSSGPTQEPTPWPTSKPTTDPTGHPTVTPSKSPTMEPTVNPTKSPTSAPTNAPTTEPTVEPTVNPTTSPSSAPTAWPTPLPTDNPSMEPTKVPTTDPTGWPTPSPSDSPSMEPTPEPTPAPTGWPTPSPSDNPSMEPTKVPTEWPTANPTTEPPTPCPTPMPTTGKPSAWPTKNPTAKPTQVPTKSPVWTKQPTKSPVWTKKPTKNPTTGTPTEGEYYHMETPAPTKSRSYGYEEAEEPVYRPN